jgi:hypothetical protein
LGPISEFLGDPSDLKPVPTAEIRKFGDMAVSQWCNFNGVYQLPTVELIDWLREEIGGRPAIEIGAGNGSIGRALGIPRTDSYLQTSPEMQLLYKMMGQQITEPPPDVDRVEASDAVIKYKPEVVIGCWVTQRFDASKGDVEGRAQALAGGIDEEWIVDNSCVKKYIVVGNRGSHGQKRILSRDHVVHTPDFLVSRSLNQRNNRIWVWGS